MRIFFSIILMPLLFLSLSCDNGPSPGQTPENCGPSNCDGCCEGDLCFEGTAEQACGSGGIACVACPHGHQCKDGACVDGPDECIGEDCEGNDNGNNGDDGEENGNNGENGNGESCGPANCNGCCDFTTDQCRTGLSDQACGSGGVECAACGSNEKCSSKGLCMPKIGQACDAQQCEYGISCNMDCAVSFCDERFCEPSSPGCMADGCVEEAKCLNQVCREKCPDSTTCSHGGECTSMGGGVSLCLPQPEALSMWEILAVSAKISPTKADGSEWGRGAPDPYVSVQVGTLPAKKTSFISKTIEPDWGNESLGSDYRFHSLDAVSVQVWNYIWLSGDELIDEFEIDLRPAWNDMTCFNIDRRSAPDTALESLLLCVRRAE